MNPFEPYQFGLSTQPQSLELNIHSSTQFPVQHNFQHSTSNFQFPAHFFSPAVFGSLSQAFPCFPQFSLPPELNPFWQTYSNVQFSTTEFMSFNACTGSLLVGRMTDVFFNEMPLPWMCAKCKGFPDTLYTCESGFCFCLLCFIDLHANEWCGCRVSNTIKRLN